MGHSFDIDGSHRVQQEAVQLAVFDEYQGLAVGRPCHGGIPVEGFEQSGTVSTGDPRLGMPFAGVSRARRSLSALADDPLAVR